VAWLAVGLFLGGAALVLSWALGHAVRCLAPRVGLVDVPGGRKAHQVPTPLGGGLAIASATTFILGCGWLAVGPLRPWLPLPEPLAIHADGLRDKAGTLWLLIGLSWLILLMGLADDRRALNWRPRLAIQFALAGMFVWWGDRITLFWPLSQPLVSGGLTVLWIVGLTNAFNFLDNMDGLAAGVALIAAALLAAASALVGGLFVPVALIVLIGALAGFLIHNRPPARLFMGDAGSNFLGFVLGGLSVLGTFTRVEGVGPVAYAPHAALTPLLVMAVPLYDTISVILIRLREGRSPFQPDRRHFSHRLVARGLTPPRAVATIHLVTLAGGLGALLLHRLDGLGAAVVASQTLCLLGIVAILESTSGASATLPVNSQPQAIQSNERPEEGDGVRQAS